MVHRTGRRRLRAGGDARAGHNTRNFCEIRGAELQRRGPYHRIYAGATLRENLGIPVPHATWRNRTMKLGFSTG